MKHTALILALTATAVFAQGPLAPTGPPAGTGKSLQQIFDVTEQAVEKGEKRTPISALPFTITQPGSYYLTRNLTATAMTDTIRVNASNVTLDLNGFSLDGANLFGTGISTDGAIVTRRTRILNGNITGFGYGIYLAGGLANDQTVEHISSDCLYGGITLGHRSIVKNCRVNGAGGITVGTESHVADCTIEINGGNGVTIGSGTVRNVAAKNTGGLASNSDGIRASGNATIENCQLAGFSFGVSGTRGVVRDCAITAGVYGVNFSGDATVSGCTVTTSEALPGTQAGVRIASGTIEKCVVEQFATGIFSDGSSRIEDCVVRTCSTRGIATFGSSTVSRCNVRDGGGNGIVVTINSIVTNCVLFQNAGVGIHVSGSTIVRDNECSQNGTGISCQTGGGNRLEGNHIGGNFYGIRFFVGSNTAIKNTLHANTTQISGAAGNQVAPLENASTSTNPWANIEL